MSDFLRANRFVFEAEKGLADLPWDKGGRTNFGITTATWNNWRDRLGKPGQPVDACTKEDARRIYEQDYWRRGRCDALPWPLSLVHFDSMVQHGAAPKLLQRALGVKEDGVIGKQTLAAAAPGRARELAEQLIWVRLMYYRDLLDYGVLMKGVPGNYAHIRGWIARMKALRDYVVGGGA